MIKEIKNLYARYHRIALIDTSYHVVAEYANTAKVALEFALSEQKVIDDYLNTGKGFRGGMRLFSTSRVEKLRKRWIKKREDKITLHRKKLQYQYGADKVKIKMAMNEFLLHLN